MDWVGDFYTRQWEWLGCAGDEGEVTEFDRKNALVMQRVTGIDRGSILELGAGSGTYAAAAADLGYSVVAIELVDPAVENARRLAESRADRVTVIQGDFYEVDLERTFDIVCYWDGFGIGSDADQRRLLERISGWLSPGGAALIEAYTPWFWAATAGTRMRFGDVIRSYDFDREGSRMIDRWWPVGDESKAVSQSLRCYAPDDFEALIAGTGLRLSSIEPRGAFDHHTGRFEADVPLGESMMYLACVRPV